MIHVNQYYLWLHDCMIHTLLPYMDIIMDIVWILNIFDIILQINI